MDWLGDTLEVVNLVGVHPESSMTVEEDFCPDVPALTLLTVTVRNIYFIIDHTAKGWGMSWTPTTSRKCALVVAAEKISWSTSFRPHPNFAVVKREQGPDAVIDWIARSNYKSFGCSILPSSKKKPMNYFNQARSFRVYKKIFHWWFGSESDVESNGVLRWPQGCYDEAEWAVDVNTFWTQIEGACRRLTSHSMQVDDGVKDGERLTVTINRDTDS